MGLTMALSVGLLDMKKEGPSSQAGMRAASIKCALGTARRTSSLAPSIASCAEGASTDKLQREATWLSHSNQRIITAIFRQAIHNRIQIVVVRQQLVRQGESTFHF
jgi:hypothetical protein